MVHRYGLSKQDIFCLLLRCNETNAASPRLATVTPFTVAPPSNKQQGPGILNAAAAVEMATQDQPKAFRPCRAG